MKKLELKNLKIKELSKNEQANIHGKKGSRAAFGTVDNSNCDPSFTYLSEIPDAPGGACVYVHTVLP